MASRRWFWLARLFLLVAVASCGSGPLGKTPDGGGGAGRSAAGTGGTTGTAGSAAGTGGTAGTAGSAAGTGGTTGTGGRSGAGGVSGPGGSAGGTGGSTGGMGGSTGGTGGRSGAGGGTGAGGSTGSCGKCQGSLSCCGSQCLDLKHDQLNCGACGNRCPSDKAFCADGACTPIPCGDQIYPTPVCHGTTCCGRECCQANQICCDIADSVDRAGCYTPTADKPNCPIGCGALGLCQSDRNIKRALAPVDIQQVLTKVSHLPISTWQYLSDPASVRHMGPMAQDFKQAFGLGDTDRAYYPVDGHGVALAAIQALAKLADDQRRRIDLLQRQNQALERRLQALEKR